jgi:predicted DNA-binding transcriptional regulator AlpA
MTSAHQDPEALLDARALAQLLAVSLVTVWRMVNDKRLPPPVYLTPRAPRWVRREVLAAREQLPRMLPREAKMRRRGLVLEDRKRGVQ